MNPSSSPGRRILLLAALLFLVTAVVYAPSARFDFVHYDDDVYVTSNPMVLGGLTAAGARWAFGFHAGNWHPLTWLSHMLDVSLFGTAPAGHHLHNVLLHALNALLLFLVLGVLTSSWPRSALVAALFALHPLHVESVAWVSERKDLLSTFWGLTAIAAYAWYLGRPSAARYLSVMGAFALSLLAKPMLVTLPFLLLLLDWWPLRRFSGAGGSWRLFRGAVVEKIPLLGLAAVSSLLTFLAQRGGNAVIEADIYPLGMRLQNVPLAYLDYLRRSFFPVGLAYFYPVPRHYPSTTAVAGGLLLLIGLTVVCMRCRHRRYLAVGWFWFLGSLVPVIGLLQVGDQLTADRYTYLPLTGLFIIAVWGLGDLLATSPLGRRAAAALAAGALIACLLLTVRQEAVWRDSRALFTHGAAVTHDSWVAQYNLGALLADEGKTAEAIVRLEESLRIEAEHDYTYYALGKAKLALGRTAEAVDDFRRALAVNPENTDALFGLAIATAGLRRWAETEDAYQKLLGLRPDSGRARYNYALLLISLGRQEEAVGQYVVLQRTDPEIASQLRPILLSSGPSGG